jgi:tRNA(adenine34) deaminase
VGDFMNNKFMRIAIKEAERAKKIGEIPVGAVIVKDGKVLSKAHNLKESKNIATFHAEIIAIEKACKKLDNWRLIDCEMYVTLEPCFMCYGAIEESRISKLYIGSKSSVKTVQNCKKEYGILEKECTNMLKSFFTEIRKW